jgi:hypothetical protein
MSGKTHITAEQSAGYRRRTLSVEELREVDAHLSGCGECRDALFVAMGGEARLSELRFECSEHLNYEQVAALAEGGLGDASGAEHLRECVCCRAEVDDLRAFRGQLQRKTAARQTYGKWIGIAAAVAVLAGVALWNRPMPGPQPVAVSRESARPKLSAEHQRLVESAVASGKLERAPILDKLISRRGVLLGDGSESKSFDLVSPLGTVVLEDRPTLQWQPLPGAKQYVVSLFDEEFRPVVESPALRETQWQPPNPLSRGRVFIWQVTAATDGDPVRSPVPPAPEARFQIAPAETAEGIAQLRREEPENHLALAAVSAQAGALDEAAAEVEKLAVTQPELAAKLRASLTKMRGR